MKKTLTVVLMIAMLALLVGCRVQKQTAPVETEAEEDNEVVQIEQDIAEIDDLDTEIDLSDLDSLEEDLALI